MSNGVLITIPNHEEIRNNNIKLDLTNSYQYKDVVFTVIQSDTKENSGMDFFVIDFDGATYSTLYNMVIFCGGDTIKDAIVNFMDIIDEYYEADDEQFYDDGSDYVYY